MKGNIKNIEINGIIVIDIVLIRKFVGWFCNVIDSVILLK